MGSSATHAESHVSLFDAGRNLNAIADPISVPFHGQVCSFRAIRHLFCESHVSQVQSILQDLFAEATPYGDPVVRLFRITEASLAMRCPTFIIPIYCAFLSRSMKGTRAERLIANAEGMDAVVIANDGEPFLDSTFWYLTEQKSGTFEGSFAVAGPGGSLDVIVSILEEEGAREGAGDVHVYRTREERDGFLRDALKGCSKVGFNAHSASYAAVEYVKKTVEGIEAVDAGKAIADTVSVKDEKEIAATREACRISSVVAGEIPGMLSEGASEKEVAAKMDSRMRELGGTGNAFDTIAAFGAYSSQPHHMPCGYRLKKGDTALFDFGTKYDRYCSDMTRTVFLGKPPEILERAYEVVRRAQLAGIAEYRDGAKASAADLAARKIIDESEFKGRFIHSFGHGIGMDVHQDISVSPRSEQVLRAGNVVSAEPGIYIPGVGGIRIEDTCLITEDGCEVLTSFDHSFTVV